MDISIDYSICRETPDGEEISLDLRIDGTYDPGEAPSRWGYYGACPGSPAEACQSGMYFLTPEGTWMPWEGELTPEEQQEVGLLLEEAGEKALEAARESWAEDVAESRRSDRYND